MANRAAPANVIIVHGKQFKSRSIHPKAHDAAVPHPWWRQSPRRTLSLETVEAAAPTGTFLAVAVVPEEQTHDDDGGGGGDNNDPTKYRIRDLSTPPTTSREDLRLISFDNAVAVGA